MIPQKSLQREMKRGLEPAKSTSLFHSRTHSSTFTLRILLTNCRVLGGRSFLNLSLYSFSTRVHSMPAGQRCMICSEQTLLFEQTTYTQCTLQNNDVIYTPYITLKKDIHCTLQYNAILYITIQCHTVHYNTMPYCTLQYNVLLYITIQCHTVHHNAMSHCTSQYNAILYITMQCHTVHHNTMPYCHTMPAKTDKLHYKCAGIHERATIPPSHLPQHPNTTHTDSIQPHTATLSTMPLFHATHCTGT